MSPIIRKGVLCDDHRCQSFVNVPRRSNFLLHPQSPLKILASFVIFTLASVLLSANQSMVRNDLSIKSSHYVIHCQGYGLWIGDLAYRCGTKKEGCQLHCAQ